MVNRVTTHGNAVNREDRKPILFIVIPSVITIRSFQRMFVASCMRFIWVNMTFEDDLGGCWHAQLTTYGFNQFGSATSQQTRKLIFRQAVRYWRHCA